MVSTVRFPQQLIDALDEVDIRIARIRRAMALHDGGEAETVDRANDGCVKDPAGEAEPASPTVSMLALTRERAGSRIQPLWTR